MDLISSIIHVIVYSVSLSFPYRIRHDEYTGLDCPVSRSNVRNGHTERLGNHVAGLFAIIDFSAESYQ